MTGAEVVVALILGARSVSIREAARNIAVMATSDSRVKLAEPSITFKTLFRRGGQASNHLTALRVVTFHGKVVEFSEHRR